MMEVITLHIEVLRPDAVLVSFEFDSEVVGASIGGSIAVLCRFWIWDLAVTINLYNQQILAIPINDLIDNHLGNQERSW